MTTSSLTTSPSTSTTSGTSGIWSQRMTEATRWMLAGFIMVAAVGTQLVVELQTATVDAGSFIGSHVLQIVIVAAGLVFLVGGIVKCRRS